MTSPAGGSKTFQVWTIIVHGTAHASTEDRFVLVIVSSRALLAQDKAIKVVRGLYSVAGHPGLALRSEVADAGPTGPGKVFEGQVRTVSGSFAGQLG